MINTGKVGELLGGAAHSQIPINPNEVIQRGIVRSKRHGNSRSKLPSSIVIKK